MRCALDICCGFGSFNALLLSLKLMSLCTASYEQQVDRFIWPLRERSRQSLTTSSQDSSHFRPCHTTWFIALSVALSGMTKVGKAGGDMWKSMSDEVGGSDDESDKSKSGVNGDEDDESVGDEEDNEQALSQKTRSKWGNKLLFPSINSGKKREGKHVLVFLFGIQAYFEGRDGRRGG